MDLELNGKKAFVLGGSKGIGRGIAEALAAEGVAVAICSRSRESLERAATEIGRGTIAVAADVGNHEALFAAFEEAAGTLGGIDILVNNSGGPPPSGVAGVATEIWRGQFEAMVLSLIRLTDRALPAMRERRFGRILTVASSGVVQPLATIGVSNTLRSALVGWSKTLAGEVARDGITVNLLLPGRIGTDRTTQLDTAAARKQGKSIEDVAAQARGEIPVGRYGTPAEFGAVAAFLASPKAGYVTGSMIRIDGGAIRSI